MPWTESARRQYARTATRYTTDLTGTEPARAATEGGPARGPERHPLSAAHQLPLGPPAQGVAGQEHGVRLFPALVGGWNLADTARQAGRGGARAGRQGGLADRWHRLQPERADHRSRRPHRL